MLEFDGDGRMKKKMKKKQKNDEKDEKNWEIDFDRKDLVVVGFDGRRWR